MSKIIPNPLVQEAFSPDTFRKTGHRLVDLLASYLESILSEPDLPVYPPITPEDSLKLWQSLPDTFKDEEELINFFQKIIENNVHTHHPRFVGHQVAAPAPLTALSDLLSSLMNSGQGVFEMGSPMVTLERLVIQEVAQQIGYPESADGFLTSGGSLGNLTAMLSARQTQSTYDAWSSGKQEDMAIMVSGESHYCVDRAARILGWGDAGIISVPVNAQKQMSPEHLETSNQEALAQGRKVIAVVVNACSTSTGSYDPIEPVADFCEKYGIWLHVDGAHGAAVVFSDKYKHLCQGIHRADSVVLDFHKMLLTPALTTALVFKNGQHSYQTFAQQAQYLWEDNAEPEWYNLGKRTLECTKTTMSLRVFVLLKMYGADLFAQHIDHLYDLGQAFGHLLRQQEDFDLFMDPQSNIICFRMCPQEVPHKQLNALNGYLRRSIIQEGFFYIVQTRLSQELYLRCTLINPFTRIEHLEQLMEEIRKHYHAWQSLPLAAKTSS